MKTYYFLVASGLAVVIGLLFYPSVHLAVGSTNTTGFLPLTTTGVVLLPYVFLGFIVYAIMKLAGK